MIHCIVGQLYLNTRQILVCLINVGLFSLNKWEYNCRKRVYRPTINIHCGNGSGVVLRHTLLKIALISLETS